MTNNDHRAQCIEAIAKTMCRQCYAALIGVTTFGNVAVIAEGIERDVNEHWEEWSERATEVLNSLHGIAHINPTSASEEMARARVQEIARLQKEIADRQIILIALVCGDQSVSISGCADPPEEKP